MTDGKRIDHFETFAPGVPVDLGWGIAVLNDDDTITRTCKGCGVTVRTGVNWTTGKVDEAPIHHRAGCTVIARLGNNPVLS